MGNDSMGTNIVGQNFYFWKEYQCLHSYTWYQAHANAFLIEMEDVAWKFDTIPTSYTPPPHHKKPSAIPASLELVFYQRYHQSPWVPDNI